MKRIEYIFISGIFHAYSLIKGSRKTLIDYNKKSLVIVSPDSLLSAFRILIESTPNIDLLAAEVSVTALQNKIGKRPDIVLAYLTKGSLSIRGTNISTKVIEELKSIWPDVYIIVIVSNSQQRAQAQTLGADEILFEGTKPDRLLMVIEKAETANK